LADFGAGRSASASSERGGDGGFAASTPVSALVRFGAGRSARSTVGLVDGFGGGVGGGVFGSAGGLGGAGGIAPGFAGFPGAAPCCGSATRALQLAHVTNFAPTGTSVSAMRATVPQAPHVASIIRRLAYSRTGRCAPSCQCCLLVGPVRPNGVGDHRAHRAGRAKPCKARNRALASRVDGTVGSASNHLSSLR
jgi:hypothetical protein